ncbi:competence type IV pilus minor pilin ComGG [Bacillus sp. S3]|uniref:competence type IV pilus minor pilin ComGG n=1 Tax=Bacillus sp. S3 TaxID=486398 RepID=UPI0016819462|nr:competence type IV pilus minor pilin ComGG [Bacillus sp. S3]
MKYNEKGFTYPLVLCLLIIFLLFFSMQIEQLVTERKMAHETTSILQQEYYLLSSVKKMESAIQNNGMNPSKGSIVYVNGTMDYQAEIPAGSAQKITFTLRMNSGETISGYGTFDTKSKKMVKWVELK